jgi:hypothetical protein
MGSYTELAVAGYPLVTSKSAVVGEVMTIFRETDRRVVERRVSERNVLVWGKHEGDDESETAIEYSCDTRCAIDRLNVMGFTLRRVRDEFEHAREHEIENCGTEADDSEWLADRLGTLKNLSFDAYANGLKHVILHGLRPAPFEDRNAPDIDGIVRYVLSEDYDAPFGYLGGDVRLLIRLACELVESDTRVVQDITELVNAGYYGDDEPVCANAVHALTGGHPENAPQIILTEGSSDGAILKAALSLLYPHLVGYYSFLDFDSSRSPGGAAHLVSVVKAFAGAGITNRVIALFDNDTAARDAMRALNSIVIPSNIAIRRYPPLDMLRSYPTLGPSGLSSLDVNGLAASIELYLGEDVLQDGAGTLSPVQWKGFNDALRQYQGEVGSKGRLHDRYNHKVARCRADRLELRSSDWSGLDAILRMIFGAFVQPDKGTCSLSV